MGLTKPRASQIYDLDYKQATRVVTTTNIDLAVGAPSQVDGVNLSTNDRVLVVGQDDLTQNGIYFVDILGVGSDGTWARSTDTNSTGELDAGTIVMVTEGNVYKDTQWKLTSDDPIVIGVTPITWVINILSTVGGANTQVQYNNGGTLAGTANLTWNGSLLYVNGSASVTGDIIAANINTPAADLAEMYVSDSNYPAGTLVEFGGQCEITATVTSHSTSIAGIISTDPSYVMNSSLEGHFVLPLALTGRVPCQVIGSINKGDRLVSSDITGVATSLDMKYYQPGCIIGKALENYNSNQVGTIEVAVGRY